MLIKNLVTLINSHPENRDNPVRYDTVRLALVRRNFSKDLAWKIAVTFDIPVETLLYPDRFGDPVNRLRKICKTHGKNPDK